MPNPTTLSTEEFLKRFTSQASAPQPIASTAKAMSADEFAARFSAQSTPPPAPAQETQNTPWKIDSNPNDGAVVAGLKTAVNVIPDIPAMIWGLAKSSLAGLRDLPKIVSEEKGYIEDTRAMNESARQLEAMGGPKAPGLAERLSIPNQALKENVYDPISALPRAGMAAIDLATHYATGGKGTNILSDEDLAEAQKAMTESPVQQVLPWVVGARGIAGKVDSVTRTVAENKMGDYVKNLEENVRTGKPIPRGTGTNFGPAIDTAISKTAGVITKPVESVFGRVSGAIKPTQADPADVAAQIFQPKTIPGQAFVEKKGAKVLSGIDTSKVKTYEDLSNVLKEKIDQNTKRVDEHFETENVGKTKLKDFKKTVEADAGGVTVKANINYVEEALSHLLEVAKKTRDVAGEARLKTIIKRAKEEGLTAGEINRIAREYGTEFGQKAFDKMGNPITSVNARAFENIRKGLKETARSFLKTDEAKALDKATSEMISAKKLVDEVQRKVNNLQQIIVKRNLIEKIGRALGTAVDLATFGGLRSFVARLFPSNIGLKTMNSVDINSMLVKNLETLKKLENADDATIVRTLVDMAKEINLLPERATSPSAFTPRTDVTSVP